MGTFEFAVEQEEFRKVLQRLLSERSRSADVRRVMETDLGYDVNLWDQMAEQLSLQGLIIPSRYGGSDGSFVDLAIVFEEMGRHLFCGPYLATVGLAVNALLVIGDEKANAKYLPRIASGELIATAAIDHHRSGPGNGRDVVVHAGDSNRPLLRGSLPLVLDGHIAGLVIVAARSDEEYSYYAVESSHAGFSAHLLDTADCTRKIARVELADVPGTLLGRKGAVETTIDLIINRATVCLAAEQLGGAEHCLDMAVAYAKQRVQFGRAIGFFQAIKHMCADLLLEVESAKSASFFSAWQSPEAGRDFALAASIAKSHCSETFSRAAADNIQIHGGIGYTWEMDCHLFFKRAISSEVLLGTPRFHRELIAQELAI